MGSFVKQSRLDYLPGIQLYEMLREGDGVEAMVARPSPALGPVESQCPVTKTKLRENIMALPVSISQVHTLRLAPCWNK